MMTCIKNDQKKFLLNVFSILFILLLTGSFELNAQENKTEEEIVKMAESYLKTLYWLQNEYIYSREMNLEEFITDSIQNVLQSLDEPYTRYIDPGALTRQKDNIFSGHFGGIGITTAFQNEKLTVISVTEDAPAWKAGIKSGDLVVKIDQKNTEKMSKDEVSNLIRGEIGTKVSLTISREGLNEFLDFSVIREEIKAATLERRILETNHTPSEKTDSNPSLGYIKITSFNINTSSEFEEAIRYFSGYPIEGILMDLRHNSGGLLEAATQIASLLIPKGVLVYIQSREGNFFTINAKGNHFPLFPLVVLVNEKTASAAEILAGAIQSHKRGILIGVQTFGKGLIQQVFDLPNGAGLSVSTSEYFTADKSPIHHIGIKPDVIVEEIKENETDEQLDYGIQYIRENMNQLNSYLQKMTRNQSTYDKTLYATDD